MSFGRGGIKRVNQAGTGCTIFTAFYAALAWLEWKSATLMPEASSYLREVDTNHAPARVLRRLSPLCPGGKRLPFVGATAGRSLLRDSAKLVADVIYNELHDRECDSFWEYRSERISGTQNVVREQVETADGPIFRVIEDHGNPLGAAERQREEERLRELVGRPGAMARIRQEHEQDEERLKKVMEMLPDAFLFEYDGASEGDRVRIAFRPNPVFVPGSYEARVVHALGGTLTVNQHLKRMIDMDGRLMERVDFGYGILGHVEKDGTFEIRREQVSETHWKTDLVEVHIQGKVLLFKNVTKDQRESRWDFRPVPHDISVAAAKELLDQAGKGRTETGMVRGEQ
jgi:hypothetical protein